MIKRPLLSIMKDYAQVVEKFLSAQPLIEEAANGGKSVPFFIRAKDPGPLIPTDEAVAAMGTLRELLPNNNTLLRWLYFDPRTVKKITAMQGYVLGPTDAKLHTLVQILREEEMPKLHQELKASIEKQQEWQPIEPLVTQLRLQEGRHLSTLQINKLKLLTQVEAIIGVSFINSSTVSQLFPGKDVVEPGRYQTSINYAQKYYDNGQTSALIEEVYTRTIPHLDISRRTLMTCHPWPDTRREWVSSLTHFGSDLVGGDSISKDMNTSMVLL